MPSKLTRSKIVKKLDAIFSQYIRLKDADHNGNELVLRVAKLSTIKMVCNAVIFKVESIMQLGGWS